MIRRVKRARWDNETTPPKTSKPRKKKIRQAKRLDLARLWLLRGAVTSGAEDFDKYYRNDDFRELAKLPQLLGHPCKAPRFNCDQEYQDWLRTIVDEIDVATAKAIGDRREPPVPAADELAERLSLDEVERDVLALVVLQSIHQGLQTVLMYGGDAFVPACRWLSRMLGYSEQRVRKVMSPHGTLARIGFIEPSGRRYTLSTMLEPVLQLSEALLSIESSVDIFFARSKPAALEISDYPHLEAEIRLATRYLRGAVESKALGVNVLLHGPPGTGKTELARLLAAECGVPAYDVAVSDQNESGQNGRGRMTSYLVCQRALGKNGGAIVLFDEAEDVFPVHSFPFFGQVSEKAVEKGWICRELEENPLPAIWVANAVSHIDPAHLRRFDVVIEVPIPPPDVRRRIASRHLESLEIETRFVDEIAACESVSPSDVKRAARVATLASLDDAAERTALMRTVLKSSLSVRGLRAPVQKKTDNGYDLSLVRASCDLAHLVGSLGKKPVGTVCLYGPPGTGKTAFVKHAAERLGLELVVHRGSDLLSKWVGETEARIARMFRDSRPEKDLLFLDEADSFLRNREFARASWEVTQVNELLTQMESFEGLFVCATNLLDDLDEASFRRFGLKIRFDHLDPDRRYRFACTELAAIGIPLPDEEIADFRRRMDALDHLSLGDFAAVRKRFKLVAPPANAAEYADALAEERSFKKEARVRRAGFTS